MYIDVKESNSQLEEINKIIELLEKMSDFHSNSIKNLTSGAEKLHELMNVKFENVQISLDYIDERLDLM